MTDLDELRKLAEKATPGPWFRQGAGHHHLLHGPDRGGTDIGDFVAELSHTTDDDARYIAATNPVTILRLLDLIQDAAISSSSATETQDGERPGLRPAVLTLLDLLDRRGAIWVGLGHETRSDLEASIGVVRTALATPTPDDRDREVERIAAVLPAALNFYVLPPRTVDDPFWRERAEQIVAGLRASGGTEA